MHRSEARAPCGEKVYGALSGNRFSRESFIAAKKQNQILAPFCYTGTCNTILFNTWLETMLIPELKAGQVIMLDNASFHKSATSIEMIKQAGCEFLFLPPYSPDLNPIETFWANFKRKVKSVLEESPSLARAIDQSFLEVCI
jgi:transposase